MKLSFPLAAAFAALLSLSACGGGGGDFHPGAPGDARRSDRGFEI